MSLRSALFGVVFVSAAALACSSGNAGFSAETQGGSSGGAGRTGGLGAAGSVSGSGGSDNGDAGMSEAGFGTGGDAGAGNVSGNAGSAGTAGNAGVSGTSGSAGMTDVGGGGSSTGGGGAGMSGGGTAGMGGSGGAPGTFCPAGSLRCADHDVQACNSNGSAWLYSSTCVSGCAAGLCTGTCTPGAKRCNGSSTEICASTGVAWNVTASCATFCDATSATCALDGLDVTAGGAVLDGEIVVKGTVHVHGGANLSSPTGNLTLRADAIIVDSGGSITVAATGLTTLGKGGNSCAGTFGAGGGAYGVAGSPAPGGQNCNGIAGAAWGLTNDALVAPGSPGGDSNTVVGANGGGVLRLIASTINIAGQVSANGATSLGSAGAGSGGGILFAASDTLTVTGSVSASGGLGLSSGTPNARSGAGGLGRVKLLYGAAVSITGSVVGTRTDGLLPPLTLGSPSQPDSTLSYNDNFAAMDLSWNRPFDTTLGYYVRVDGAVGTTVTPANGTFGAPETASVPRSALVQGSNYFHVVAVNAQSSVGAVQSWFKVQLNTLPPTLTSSTHQNQGTWYQGNSPFFSWFLPAEISAQSVRSYYYVLDHLGNTVPTSANTLLSGAQQNILLSGLADGVWVFHLVSVDTRGNTTTAAAHYQVRIGADPGTTSASGKVTTGAASAVAGATVTINNGLFGNASTDANGNYVMTNLPAGSYTLTVSKAGYTPSAQPITLTKNVLAQINVTLN